MTTAAAPERAFTTFQRGELREEILASFRFGLRKQTNPATGLPFSEEDVAAATAKFSRWWNEADAVDVVLQPGQARALWLTDQIDPRTAGTSWLEGLHATLWKAPKLPATGGSGPADAPAPAGTVFVGSTTVPDPAATYATDPKGLRFQVLYTTATPGNGVAKLVLVGIDTGKQTNLATGAKLTWANAPIGASKQAVTTADFSGGTEAETDAEQGARILRKIRRREAAGNQAHWRTWAVDASNAVEEAFVFACALHAGTVLVAITQKRGTTKGPLARIPSAGTLAAAVSYLTPPSSPVAPVPPLVVVVGCTPVASHLSLSLSLPRGRVSGWADLAPFPGAVGGVAPAIVAVANQTHFTLTSSAPLPGGGLTPKMMVWNDATSEFEQLQVASVVSAGGSSYTVVLAAAPTKTLAVGDYVSPYAARADLIAQTIGAYFDSLGPGEVVDLATDLRAHRAARFPDPSEEFPPRAGANVTSWLQDVFGAALGDSTLDAMSQHLPAVPSSPEAGPRLLVLGRVSLTAL
jgi:hypothetical protein